MSVKDSDDIKTQNEDILDTNYNPSTQAFLLKAGLKPGMTVLEVGCGTGLMSTWIAKQVGPMGQVFAIDDNSAHLELTQKRIKQARLDNIETQILSAYEIDSFHTEFDLIYSRFLLHHLQNPRDAIDIFFEHLHPDGLYIAEEYVMHMAYAYPPTFAWSGYPLAKTSHTEDTNGDSDIGTKLFYECQQAGFTVLDCQMHQPLLWEKAQKAMLLDYLEHNKNQLISQGMTEDAWQERYTETLKLIDDPLQLIAFYASCKIAAKK